MTYPARILIDLEKYKAQQASGAIADAYQALADQHETTRDVVMKWARQARADAMREGKGSEGKVSDTTAHVARRFAAAAVLATLAVTVYAFAADGRFEGEGGDGEGEDNGDNEDGDGGGDDGADDDDGEQDEPSEDEDPGDEPAEEPLPPLVSDGTTLCSNTQSWCLPAWTGGEVDEPCPNGIYVDMTSESLDSVLWQAYGVNKDENPIAYQQAVTEVGSHAFNQLLYQDAANLADTLAAAVKLKVWPSWDIVWGVGPDETRGTGPNAGVLFIPYLATFCDKGGGGEGDPDEEQSGDAECWPGATVTETMRKQVLGKLSGYILDGTKPEWMSGYSKWDTGKLFYRTAAVRYAMVLSGAWKAGDDGEAWPGSDVGACVFTEPDVVALWDEAGALYDSIKGG